MSGLNPGAGRRAIAIPSRAVAVLVVAGVAYNYSLVTLLRGVSLQTPLAYLALVPVIALLLAWVRLRRGGAGLPIHDRQVDYIVGLGLILVAAGVSLLVPSALGTRFWLYRIDLLTLPFFVGGMVALVYGVRRLWTLRFPLAFLFLAWPLPYAPLLGDGSRLFTDATATVLAGIAHILPVATPSGGDDAVFFIRHAGFAFPLSVSEACAGVNSLVGYLLVGGALSYIVAGPLLRRLVWLGVGMALAWTLNIVRIELIFAVGAGFGRDVAIDVLHPLAGLVAFNLGVLAMLLIAPRFGLSFDEGLRATTGSAPRREPVTRVAAALAIVLAIGLGLGTVNASYARFEQVASPLGQPLLRPFDVRTAQLAQWTSAFVARNAVAPQFFGDGATWDRIQYTPGSDATLRTNLPVYIDVITTSDSGSFAAYGLEACYQFHGYQIQSSVTADIGAGVQGQVLDYQNPRLQADWSALWWEWPFQDQGQTRFERIVIFIGSGPRGTYVGGAGDVPAARDARFSGTDRFLVAMARALVASQLAQAAT